MVADSKRQEGEAPSFLRSGPLFCSLGTGSPVVGPDVRRHGRSMLQDLPGVKAGKVAIFENTVLATAILVSP